LRDVPAGWLKFFEPTGEDLRTGAAAILDAQTGDLHSQDPATRRSRSTVSGVTEMGTGASVEYADSGGPSRFYLTVTPDKICGICNLSCVAPAGNPSLHDAPANGTAQSHAQAPQPLEAAANGRRPNASAPTAANDSPPTASVVSAPPDAPTHLAAWIVQLAQSAASLCEPCATATARNVAQSLQGQTPASPHGAASTSERRQLTLSQSLALIAAGSRSTGTIPTTDTLSALFGSAVAATTASTTASATVGDSGLTRFRYQSKASTRERNAGLDGFEERETRTYGDLGPDANARPNGQSAMRRKNTHATVKPVSLMRWLVRLITPEGGTVLDPMCGSGTTGIASRLEGLGFVGIEREAEYVDIARARIAHWEPEPALFAA
jgi:hypothetical protein